ncbi:TetR/AcrR family transcriptional regulator [Vagococcus acidifermentans]|uniref:HTH tetR-type domain-containing protein n=1 Tax=Vagococcus acidifermentans TaxID=564710 RepID=A0A430AUK8_9ENTE|nr:TetR/AcrR family transcriptional regulator [Vagococcus acidifermentans]RSU11741.1 hypothetical protein CBF27_07205 [Vagococcus acidifermentans]
MPKISDDKKRENMNGILSNAKQLFILNGYKDVSVDDICKKSGISKGSFYTYFKSKEELFLEIAKESEEMKHFYSKLQNDSEGVFEEIALTLWDMIFSDITNDDIVNYRLNLEFWMESFDNHQLRSILKNKSKKSLSIFKDMIKVYLKENIDENILNTWAIFFWAQAEGLMIYYTAHQRIPTVSEISEIRKIVHNFVNYVKTHN